MQIKNIDDIRISEAQDLVLMRLNVGHYDKMVSHIDPHLKTSEPQQVILGKIRWHEVNFGQGPSEKQLSKYMKATNELRFRGPPAINLIDRRYVLTDVGTNILKVYGRHKEYLMLRDKAKYQKDLLKGGVIKREDATKLLAFQEQANKLANHKDYRNVEARLRSIVSLVLRYPALSTLRAMFKTDNQYALHNALANAKTDIELCVKACSIRSFRIIEVDEKQKFAIIINWVHLPWNTKVETEIETEMNA